jgi:hypothetical protein
LQHPEVQDAEVDDHAALRWRSSGLRNALQAYV